MAKFVAFHSFKGGTGKSTLATNFAALSALQQHNVCLLDFDFRAPSLHMFFKTEPRLWLNDFLEGTCQIDDVLKEIYHAGPGKLAVGFADPSTEAMRDMMKKDREWEAKALQKILSAKAILGKQFDLVIFDTSPGIQYASINALASSNVIVFVMNKDELNRKEIVGVVNNIYKPLGRKIGIVFNKVLFCVVRKDLESVDNRRKRLAELMESTMREIGCPVWGLIPCFCEVALEGTSVHALHSADHPFVTELAKVAQTIQSNL